MSSLPPSPAALSAAPAPVSPRLIGAIVFTVVAWASAFVVIRGVARSLDGGSIALGRLVVGTIALAIILIVSRRWVRPSAREWLLLVIYGAVWFGAYNVALNSAERTLDAGTTALVVNVGPILIAVGGALVFREGVSRWLALGFAVAFVGVVLIAVGSGARFDDTVGIVLALVAAVAYAIGVLSQKPTLRRLPGAQVTFIGCAIGLLVTLPFAGELVHGVAVAPPSAIVGLVYLGIVPTALAFSTWAYALARMPASRLGISTYIVPPLAVILSLVFFHEIPTLLAIVGGAICLVGVAVSRRGAGPKPRQPHPVPVSRENLPQ